MDDAHAIDIGTVVDRQKIGWFHVLVLSIAFLQILVDGYDLFVPGFVGPELIKAWHIAPAALGPMFSGTLIGIVIGAPLFGWVGDRWGRKKSIIIGSLLYGVLTLYSMRVTSIGELTWLRLFTGIALGGIIPNSLALAAEFAPKRVRATLVILVCMAASLGLLAPGLVAALYVATYGWPVLFLVGGVAPLVAAVVAWLWLPESIKYLVVSGRHAEVARLLHKMEKGIVLPANPRFTVNAIDVKPGLSPKKLFADGLASITLLIWFPFAVGLLTNYFIASWLPTLMQAAGASTQQVAGSAGLYAIGGIFGGLLLTRLIDKYGTLFFTVYFLVSVPCVAALGWAGISPVVLWALAFGAGMTVSGMLQAFNTTLGIIYPTSLRSKGIGWGLAVARFGAIAGPIIGGVLVGMKLTNAQIFLVPALLQLLGAAACFFLTRQCVKRFGGHGLDEKAATRAPALVGADAATSAVAS